MATAEGQFQFSILLVIAALLIIVYDAISNFSFKDKCENVQDANIDKILENLQTHMHFETKLITPNIHYLHPTIISSHAIIDSFSLNSFENENNTHPSLHMNPAPMSISSSFVLQISNKYKRFPQLFFK